MGSGFGGSVMVYRLADAGLNVCLLERGKRWPPGSFPRTPLEFKHALWDPSEGKHGLFNVWSFRGLGAVVSSGLGGGSLLYANVLLRKDERWFAQQCGDEVVPWPVSYAELEPHYEAVENVLKPTEYPHEYRAHTPKTQAFGEAAAARGLDPFYPPLAVTFAQPGDEPGRPFDKPADNIHRAQRYTCRLVGECDAGCNVGAKNTLDFTYLSAAERTGKAQIRCRQEVKAFEPCPGKGFRIEVVDHSEAVEGKRRSGRPEPYEIFAKRLILSAGALGTPYLLLANRSAFPAISRRLGTRFSGNGDYIAFAARCRTTVNGRRVPRALEPSRGPVITMALRIADALDENPPGDGPGFYIEDGGYPQFAAWIAELLDSPRISWAERRVGAKLLWGWLTGHRERELNKELSQLIGGSEVSWATLPVLGMGRELPQGRMRLRGGRLDVDWSFKRAGPYYERVRRTVRAIAEEMGGQLEDNVLWHLNAVMTAHPLGGCPLGRSADEGVVDPITGEVFGYPGLHVADGSVMPGPVGTNPSLTIAALADRFAAGIIAKGRP